MRGLVPEIDHAHRSLRPRGGEAQAAQLPGRGVQSSAFQAGPTGHNVRLAAGRQWEALEARELEHGRDETPVALLLLRGPRARIRARPPRLAQPRGNGQETEFAGLEAGLGVIW